MATETSRTKVAPANVLRGVDWETYNRLRDHPSNGHSACRTSTGR